MSRDISYGDVVPSTRSVCNDEPADIDVRVTMVSTQTDLGSTRKVFRYHVVDHDAEEVLFTSRKARQHQTNPSPAEVSGQARGFRQGYLAARD